MSRGGCDGWCISTVGRRGGRGRIYRREGRQVPRSKSGGANQGGRLAGSSFGGLFTLIESPEYSVVSFRTALSQAWHLFLLAFPHKKRSIIYPFNFFISPTQSTSLSTFSASTFHGVAVSRNRNGTAGTALCP